MHRIKTTALIFIAIVACLMMLLTPRQTATSVKIPAPAKHNQLIPFEQAKAITQDRVMSIERDQTNLSFPISIPEQTVEEPLVWYPELEQIWLLENAPATQAIFELQPMLSSVDPVIRLAAIESLGDMTIPAALPALAAALDDPNPQLRIAALEGMASHEDISVVSSIEPYLYDQDREVRVAAIEALVELESETAVPALAGLLSDPDSLIRHQAVYALGEIGGEYAISYLLQARYDPDERIRANAESILIELGS